MNGLSQVVDPYVLTAVPSLPTTAGPTALTDEQTIALSERQLAFETYANKALVETDRALQPIVCTSQVTDFADHNVFNGLTDADHSLNSYFCDPPLIHDWNQFSEPLIPDNSLVNGSLINGNDFNCFVNYETNYNISVESKANPNDNCSQEIPKRSATKLSATKKSRKEYNNSNRTEKTVSAYALFFRDAQSVIKAQNPSASFGEISKIVASNWETLDNDNKNLYKQRAEQEKKKLLKKRAADRAQEIAGLMAARLGSAEPAPQKVNDNLQNDGQPCNDQSGNDGSGGDNASRGHSQVNHIQTNGVPNSVNSASQLQQNLVSSSDQSGAVPRPHCIREGCANDAVESSEWDNEYCSSDCCVRHCADVFQAWVQRQRLEQQFPQNG